jgi:hypothetical protein
MNTLGVPSILTVAFGWRSTPTVLLVNGPKAGIDIVRYDRCICHGKLRQQVLHLIQTFPCKHHKKSDIEVSAFLRNLLTVNIYLVYESHGTILKMAGNHINAFCGVLNSM